MKSYEMMWQRLPLHTCANARELGGYPTADGSQTAWHRFVRSDRLSFLDDDEREFLYGYGVRTVIDLRGSQEIAEHPDIPISDDVAYRHITLLDLNIADSRLDELMKSDREPQALDFYGTILENTEGFRKVVHAILETPEDACVLFHCTEGKDRTGILAMLLLSLAGVDRTDCIANYERTRENILRKPYYAHDFAQAGSRQKLMGSDPDTIAVTYDFVMQRYGSAEGYFHACGVSDAAIAALRKRLVVSA